MNSTSEDEEKDSVHAAFLSTFHVSNKTMKLHADSSLLSNTPTSIPGIMRVIPQNIPYHRIPFGRVSLPIRSQADPGLLNKSRLSEGAAFRVGSEFVRAEEAALLLLVLVLWFLAISLFINRWGKLRMLEPYQPAYSAPPSSSVHSMNCSPSTNLVNLSSTTSTQLPLVQSAPEVLPIARKARLESLGPILKDSLTDEKEEHWEWVITAKSPRSSSSENKSCSGKQNKDSVPGLSPFNSSKTFLEYRRASSGTAVGLGLGGNDSKGELELGIMGKSTGQLLGSQSLSVSGSNQRLSESSLRRNSHHSFGGLTVNQTSPRSFRLGSHHSISDSLQKVPEQNQRRNSHHSIGGLSTSQLAARNLRRNSHHSISGSVQKIPDESQRRSSHHSIFPNTSYLSSQVIARSFLQGARSGRSNSKSLSGVVNTSITITDADEEIKSESTWSCKSNSTIDASQSSSRRCSYAADTSGHISFAGDGDERSSFLEALQEAKKEELPSRQEWSSHSIVDLSTLKHAD